MKKLLSTVAFLAFAACGTPCFAQSQPTDNTQSPPSNMAPKPACASITDVTREYFAPPEPVAVDSKELSKTQIAALLAQGPAGAPDTLTHPKGKLEAVAFAMDAQGQGDVTVVFFINGCGTNKLTMSMGEFIAIMKSVPQA